VGAVSEAYTPAAAIEGLWGTGSGVIQHQNSTQARKHRSTSTNGRNKARRRYQILRVALSEW